MRARLFSLPIILLLSTLTSAGAEAATTFVSNIDPVAKLAERKVNAVYPPATLRTNLLKLAQDIELSIFFAEETVSGYRVEAVDTVTTVSALLNLWLSQHCLEADFIRDRFVTISAREPCLADYVVSAPKEPPAPLSPPPPVMEEILVRERTYTGSRLRQSDFSKAMPIDVIDQQEIQLSGIQSVSELLRYVPAVSGNSTSTLISNGGDGSATITLRGLPASNTLVLLNGRRTNYNALSGDAVNLNTLPLAMVERIEILKDGVSAIYGADAVAGVVNIITKQAHDGFSADVYHGVAADGDLGTTQISLQSGFVRPKWHGSLNFSAYQQDGIFSRDRDRSDSSDDRRHGGINKQSSATAPALIITSNGVRRLAPGATGSSLDDYLEATSEDRFEYRDFTSSIVPLDRYGLYANIGYGSDLGWQFGADLIVSHTEADTYLAPIPVFTGFESVPLTIAADNPFNVFGEELYDVRRRVVEFPSRRQENSTTSYQVVVNSKFQADTYSIAAAIQYDKTQAEERRKNGLRADRLAEALGSSCSAPCVPFNLLGPVGSITPAMLAYTQADTTVRGASTLQGLTIDFDWQPPQLNIAVAAGVETRRERLHVDPDFILLSGLHVAGGNRGETRGDRSIIEAYGEIYAPLLTRGDTDILALQVATRISHYSDFGSVSNPRVVLNWLPSDAWSLRLSWGKGFRAPTLPQLKASTKQSFQQLNDPCTAADNDLPGCLQQSDPSLNQFLTITGGNNDLKPERSTTMTLGTAWEHEARGILKSFSLDLFSIEQENVVDSSAQFIVNRNAQNLSFSDRIARDANGNLNRVLATLQNIGSRDVQGLDVATSVQFKQSDWGKLAIALNATHIHSFKDKFDPQSPTTEKAGTFSDEASQGLGSLPDWKVSLAANAHFKNWQLHYSIYWISRLQEEVPLSNRNRTIKDWMTHNVNLSYFGPATAWVRSTLGVQNLFDAAPPFSAAAFNDSYDGRTYDITGRYFFLKFDKAF